MRTEYKKEIHKDRKQTIKNKTVIKLKQFKFQHNHPAKQTTAAATTTTMRRALLYSAAACALTATSVSAQGPIVLPVYSLHTRSGMKTCAQFNVDAFIARAMVKKPNFHNGNCVNRGYTIAAPLAPIMVTTPGGPASARLFTKVPRDEMEAQFDMQGKGSRNPFGGQDDDDFDVNKITGIIEKIKGIKDLVRSDEESVGSGKQNGGDDDDMQATSADARQLFGRRTAVWTVLDSNRRLRKKSKMDCRQKNIQHCNHAGICTMDAVMCCGDRCSPPPPAGPPPPPPAMDLMEDYSPEGRIGKRLNRRRPGFDVFYDPTMDFSNRRLRRGKKESINCKQVNIQNCNHAGICTMTANMCCGNKCGAPPPAP